MAAAAREGQQTGMSPVMSADCRHLYQGRLSVAPFVCLADNSAGKQTCGPYQKRAYAKIVSCVLPKL